MTHSGKLQSIFLHATHMTGQHGGKKKLKGMEGRGERRVKQINLRKEKDCQKVQTFSLLPLLPYVGHSQMSEKEEAEHRI